jgi:hypothetical protein
MSDEPIRIGSTQTTRQHLNAEYASDQFEDHENSDCVDVCAKREKTTFSTSTKSIQPHCQRSIVRQVIVNHSVEAKIRPPRPELGASIPRCPDSVLGITVEYELHALSDLLSRELYYKDPTL